MGVYFYYFCVSLLAILGRREASSFQPTRPLFSLSSTAIAALSPRQLQFWEDVDEGIDDVAKYYETEDMVRVRDFCSRAKGELPLPEPLGEGHLPSEEHVDGLTARAFWDVAEDPDKFPWARKLEEHSKVIIEDLAVQGHGGGWSAVRLQRLGVWNVENCRMFPRTYNLLRELDIPFAVRGVCFARQAPGSGVAPHSDGRNFILTSHLGLRVPEGCWIKSGNEERTWEEGKLTTLDTSFEHSTGNPTDGERHVLIIDFWHPDLTEAERAGLEFVYDLRNKFESGRVPFRQPRGNKRKNGDEEEKGLAGLWMTLTGSK
ncbi:hypothetical protein THAOC_34126 [Thalassiosira oceanica]|uniref:Aspartyl/asparaginy/proline hydroxylase domain-containing protein n=1 Tax=Thalassiosira oceanica TaxID=159749 RepID=K0RKH1_THAOC|nr:hypothetical protein THAOC_34126 [Thalassiosira oceanica]|eukprot:EJK47172.1 hypothetical protein THAOC_34126 [Thalassiosira oceanica]